MKAIRVFLLVFAAAMAASAIVSCAKDKGVDKSVNKGGGDDGGDDTPVITILIHPADISVTEGEITGSLRVEASVTEEATLSYQWYGNDSASNEGGTAIEGATEASYPLPVGLTEDEYHYFAEVSAEGAESRRSDPATVTVGPPATPPVLEAAILFTDASTGTTEVTPTAEGLCVFDFESAENKTVYSVTLSGREYLIGRRSDQTVTLKLDAEGNLLFRDADTDGNIPIGTYAELAMINTDGESLAKNYIQEANLDMLGAESLTEAGLVRRNWTPTGSAAAGFTGEYECGFTISNLYVDSQADDVGLFGFVGAKGSLNGVRVVSGSVKGQNHTGGVCGYSEGSLTACANDASVSGNWETGGVCGYNKGGSVAGCLNTGAVTGAAERIGGVCGWNAGSVSGCDNEGTVNGKNRVAGICGDNTGGTIADSRNSGEVKGATRIGGVCGLNGNKTITGSSNTGDVTGTGNEVGGVCGYNDKTITGCYNAGTVTGEAAITGGVCGRNNSDLTGCYNTGAVTGTQANVGGVSGVNYGMLADSYNEGVVKGLLNQNGGVCGANLGTIARCRNSGTVTGATNNAGGISGNNNGTITRCYNTGAITGASNYVGGMCGTNSGANAILSACYNTGAISGPGQGIGGLSGYCSTGCNIVACYNTGTITGTGNGSAIGGVCGFWNSTGRVLACYSTGRVTGTGANLGGLVGNKNNAGTFDSCYYLKRGTQFSYGYAPERPVIPAFSDAEWPATDIDGWGVSADGTDDKYWKTLGSWNGGGDPAGASSAFPRLWWEE